MCVTREFYLMVAGDFDENHKKRIRLWYRSLPAEEKRKVIDILKKHKRRRAIRQAIPEKA